MKVTCQYSGIRFETPHFAASYTEAIHPIFYLSLPKLEKLAAVNCFSPNRDASDEEIHLLACAVAKQLDAFGYIRYNCTIPLVASLSPQYKINFIHTFFHNFGSLAANASNEDKPLFSVRAFLKDDTDRRIPNIFATLNDFLRDSVLEWIAEAKRSSLRLAIQQAKERAEGAMFASAEKFSQLNNHEIDARIKYVRGFIRKFGKLPMGTSNRISNPIGTGNIELGAYWLDLFDVGDDKLFMIPDSDITEFADHIMENCVLGLPVIQFALDYLKDLAARKQAACSTLGFLASFTSPNSPIYEIASMPVTQTAEVQIPKRETAAEMLARLRKGN